jgi:Tfp pilus assembly protein PilF
MSRKNSIEVRAARAFALKNYSLAIRHLNELLECVGENPHTLHMIALCHSRESQDLEALAFARRALQADERHLESLKLLARLHFIRGEHNEARMFVVRALSDQRTRENEHRQWLEWAEAYMSATEETDGGDP